MTPRPGYEVLEGLKDTRRRRRRMKRRRRRRAEVSGGMAASNSAWRFVTVQVQRIRSHRLRR